MLRISGTAEASEIRIRKSRTVTQDLPPALFDRLDESGDAAFYAAPRFVVHIDDATIAALTAWYGEVLAPGADVLDLMSSWVSHLPPAEGLPLGRVVGLGMNAEELAANPRLTGFDVVDLNAEPRLPYPDASFDAALCAVSVQYLTRPVEVFAETARVLRPGGRVAVAISHRCFPTKAIRAWHVMPPRDRLALIALYLERAGGFAPAELVDRSPPNADPLWIVTARRA
jgi:SAM-dependent methyltransferase